MPVIVYKTMTIELFYAQARRIACEHCHAPFTYITGGVESSQTTGLPLINSDEGMRRDALKQGVESLRKIAKKRRVGEAKCPHCHCFQRWMARTSHWESMGCLSVVGAIVLAIGGAIGNYVFSWTNQWKVPVVGGAIVGFLIGLIFGKLTATTVGPHAPEEDPRALTDDALRQFIDKCSADGTEPFLVWWVLLDNEPGKKQLAVSLGIDDQTGSLILPTEMGTDHVLSQFE